MSRRLRIGILGASGYGAGELLRLLAGHPFAQVACLVSRSSAGERIDRLHPHLRGFYDAEVAAELDLATLLDAEHAVVFSALPHGASGAAIEGLLRRTESMPGGGRLRIVDLSGDLRLKTPDVHARFYPDAPLLAERRSGFVYGLPEIARAAVTSARHVANPGCLAAAAILAAAPLVSSSFAGTVVIDAKTGSSGSGRQLKEATHHPTRHANLRAYKPLSHQHEPEILQALGDPLARRVQPSFVVHSADAARGIYATVHLTLPEAVDAPALRQRCRVFYAESPFVRVLEEPPELQNVVGSNFCDIGLAARGRNVVVMAALDNLVKGMAGTAIQNMNLMCGFPEATGLWSPALRPV